MRPLALRIQNFMNNRSSDIDCSQFKAALIVGKSKSNPDYSNGVGKTTIFNAIEYAIFNKMHSANLDLAVRAGQKKCKVEFEFEVDGEKYMIKRVRYASGSGDLRFSQWNGDKWQPIDERTPSETEEKLQGIIKISHRAFCHSILFRQADLEGLSEEKDGAKRKNVLKEPLNLSRYSKLEKVTKDKIFPIRKELTLCQGRIDNIGDPDKDIKAAEGELESCQEKHAAATKRADDVDQLIATKTEALQVLKRKLSNGDSEIHIKVEEQEKHLRTLNAQVRSNNASIDSHRNSLKKQEARLTELDASITKKKDKISTFEAKELGDVDELKQELKKVSADEIKGNKLITKTEVEIEQKQVSLPTDNECPACKQPITDEYRHQCEEEAKKVIDDLKEDLEFYNENLRRCRLKKSRLEAQISTAEEITSTLSAAKAVLEAEISKRDDLKESLADLLERIAKEEKEQEELSVKLAKADEEFSSLKELAKKSDAADLNNQISSLKSEIKTHQETRDSIAIQISSLQEKQGSLRERIKTRKEDKDKLIELKKKVKKLNGELYDWKMVVEAFSPRGIPTNIIHTILDELQQETNTALRMLRPELEVQFDSDLNITYRRYGQEREYNILSYGQKVYIALAFKRGLSKIIQKRLGIDLKLLIFDEIDSPMDRAGQDAVVDAVRKWQEEFKVFVITHNERLKDKFTHAILVEEDDDGAEARVVTQW